MADQGATLEAGQPMTGAAWPALPYEEWQATRDTLHMYTQVVGKLRLALSPFEPSWANVTLYVTARGLTTSPIPAGSRTFDAEFDLLDHVLVMRSSAGRIERRPLGGPVADFYGDVMAALRRMDIEVAISPVPSEVPDPIPFADDRVHDTYDPAHAARFQQVLSHADAILKQYRAGFQGRTTPVHFFWGTFDLSVTRFSGRLLTPPTDEGVIMRFSRDAEEICSGWWPGDQRYPHPAFFVFAYPDPGGLDRIAIKPSGAAWDAAAGEFLLPYDAARSEADPRQAVLDYLDTTYAGAAALARWSPDLTHVSTPSTPCSGSSRRRA
jgi:hypothetical protein